jgi:hypothetical protein
MKTRSGWFFVFLMMIIIFAEGRAYAYIDPGTGSMLWQLLFAAGIGSLFYLRKAIAWMGRLREKGRRRASLGRHPSLKSGRDAGESPPISPKDS